jgi:hypothetical protein
MLCVSGLCGESRNNTMRNIGSPSSSQTASSLWGGASLVLDLAGAEVSFVRFSAAIRRTRQLARELTAGSLSLSDPTLVGGRTSRRDTSRGTSTSTAKGTASRPGRPKAQVTGLHLRFRQLYYPFPGQMDFSLTLSQASLESPTMWKRMAIVYFVYSWWPPQLGYATRGVCILCTY